MKTVLCYGDSLTWGYNAENQGRHALQDRWPTALSDALSRRALVIPEGLNGRTTAYDDWTGDCDRNGARILPTILATHKPIDLVVIMLGSNDMKRYVAGEAIAAKQGMERLIHLVKSHKWDSTDSDVDVLIMSPPPLCETANPEFAAMFHNSIEQSKMLGSMYAELADECECGFFDAATVAETTPLDAVHLDAENTRAVGRGVASVVSVMLGL